MLNEENTEITRSSISNANSYEEIGELWDKSVLSQNGEGCLLKIF
jgi:hypothetical protein